MIFNTPRWLFYACLSAGALHPAEPSLDRLLAGDRLLAAPAELPQAKGRHTILFQGKEGESGFNLHSYLAYFEGRFWAEWSSSKVGEEDPDQHVLYATSVDGHKWSEAKVLVADPDGPEGPQRWIARGLFVDGGKLRALGALIESRDYANHGKDVVWRNLRLIRFTWSGRDWKQDSVFAADCMNNFPPMRLKGQYAMPCRDSRMQLSVAFSDAPGAASWNHTKIDADPPFDRMDEPTMYVARDDSVQMVIRDGARSKYLLRAVSRDGGSSWSKPVRTNYPDATSKNFVLKLSNGTYVLINNPNQKQRDPLAISFSRDGWVFDRPMSLRGNAPQRRYEGRAKGSGSLQYPHAMEHNGSLWVIYSLNKEDIEVSEFKLSDLGL